MYNHAISEAVTREFGDLNYALAFGILYTLKRLRTTNETKNEKRDLKKFPENVEVCKREICTKG